MKRRVMVVLAALVMALAMSAAPVFAGSNGGGGHHGKGKGKEKVCIQHYTDSKKNPYKYISVSKKEFNKSHAKHGDKIVSDENCKKNDNGKKNKKK